ncbi:MULTISPECIES: hydrogenase-4 component E [Magnetospirillum]|uniref:Hydrogenase-4 component E n=1 Tax=Magnetospirillum moscoviense TaxID=1437059 RepID=A0A178MXL7_9PROT|nr:MULTISPECIES: hydrogenase-4 component E [Magnetospirillum]MBF0324676.1 hydrogenase-4 component E [Alphaproteobacteria bacterium]OAN54271.1 hydrogenase-4 component E [Magnetospirillum moscoviense]CAA7616296.1 Hydrogenase 4, membrane subunit [Magnetospirillum sp. LM-5]
MLQQFSYDLAHLIGATVLMAGFGMLYQRRLFAVLNTFAFQALALAAAAAWQAHVQNAPHLYATAAIALIFKAIAVPIALHWLVERLGIHRTVETALSIGWTMIVGVALVALAIMLVLPVTAKAAALTRESLSIAMSVVLLGMLMMITRRNAVTQVVGFMALENGLILAAVSAKGMPLVVEISIAFSVLVAMTVFGIFFFRIRERFDSLDLHFLETYRGDRQ